MPAVCNDCGYKLNGHTYFEAVFQPVKLGHLAAWCQILHTNFQDLSLFDKSAAWLMAN